VAYVKLRYPTATTLMYVAYALMLYYLVSGQWFGSASGMAHQANVMMIVVWGFAFDRYENPPRASVPDTIQYDQPSSAGQAASAGFLG
jgi:hypothetical protein